jgi:hypothetical protein
MFRLKQMAPPIVIVLAISLTFSPLLYAQAPAGNSPAAPTAAQPSAQETAQQQVPLPEGWWKLPLTAANPEADSPFFVDQAQPASSGKTWTKGGKIMTFIGIPVAAVGAVMLAVGSDEDRIGGTDVAINWKATGAIWLAGGAVLTIIGLTRRR